MSASPYLAPAPVQLDIIADTALSRAENRPRLSTIIGGKNTPCLSTGAESENSPCLSTVTFRRVDTRRRKLGITIRELCRAAGLAPSTYADARLNRARTRSKTLENLNAALNRLAAGAEADEPRTLCQALLRLVTAQMARNAGWDPVLMLSQDFSRECPNDPMWRQAARLRRCAMYLVAEGLRIKKAAIGHAIGVTRQAVQKAVAEIEAERDRDAEFDAVMQRMMDTLKQ